MSEMVGGGGGDVPKREVGVLDVAGRWQHPTAPGGYPRGVGSNWGPLQSKVVVGADAGDGCCDRLEEKRTVAPIDVQPVTPKVSFADEGFGKTGAKFKDGVVGRLVVREDV